MIGEEIVLQSAGSFSVAVLALIMVILQIMLFSRKPQFTWYGWGAAISFSGMIYSIGIFIEYNTLQGAINRFSGLLEFTAIISIIHCMYGFTFAYLGLNGRRYHALAGIFHCLVLIFLWSTDFIVSDRFIARDFIGLAKPFVESDLGPLGPMFEFYGLMAAVGVIILWVRRKGPHLRHRAAFLSGIVFWLALAIHDGLASMGVPTIQYFMEYGFLIFSVVILWVVFREYVDISALDKYRVITEFANDGILLIQDGKTVFGNPACISMIGGPGTGLSTKDFLDVVVPEDRQLLMAHYRRLMNSVDYPGTFKVHIRRTDNEERVLEINESLIKYRNRPAIMAIMRDITERIREQESMKKNEEKLVHLRKMESLGLLAGGVAHDLNNVLSGIVSYPGLILLGLPEDSTLRKPIKTIQEAGQRAVAIVQDLLSVAGGVAITKQPLNLNDVIKEYLTSQEFKKLLQHHPGVTVKDELDEKLLNIKGSQLHIRKSVMNLVSNAAEAIDGYGEIVLSTMNRYIDHPLKDYHDVKIGEYAVMIVEDNGPGMSSDDLKRIFEPFFTKKVMGRSGTGLGLTLVWNVVQEHEGYIDVTSDEKGSRFELYFPIKRSPIAEKNLSVPLEDLYGHGEMILVIDDILSQREISCRMLEALRYKTKAVSGGEEAVEYLKEHSVDLLLLDMIMDPGIDGRETYERIKQIHPNQKAVIVSGFAETDHVKETLKMGAGRFIRKPLILEELGLAVKEELK